MGILIMMLSITSFIICILFLVFSIVDFLEYRNTKYIPKIFGFLLLTVISFHELLLPVIYKTDIIGYDVSHTITNEVYGVTFPEYFKVIKVKYLYNVWTINNVQDNTKIYVEVFEK